jgi:cytidine deaminase
MADVTAVWKCQDTMNIDFLTPHLQARLLAAAREARTRAYAPYSRFLVGAAVLDDQGRIHAGCNVENAAYPQGVCAEAGALSAMVLAGSTRAAAVAVVGAGPVWVTPCGGCRQKLREFAAPETPVLVADPDQLHAMLTLAQLLPHSFGPDNLHVSRVNPP